MAGVLQSYVHGTSQTPLLGATIGVALDQTVDRFAEREARGRIAHFEIPRYVEITDDFPMTVTGEVQKFRVREISTAELGFGSTANR